jgi:hypothetical protein
MEMREVGRYGLTPQHVVEAATLAPPGEDLSGLFLSTRSDWLSSSGVSTGTPLDRLFILALKDECFRRRRGDR